MSKVRVAVLRTAGTNCDQETAFAFKANGAEATLVHINEFLKNPSQLKRYHILALPGGFSYGDDIESGRIFGNELKFKLGKEINGFIADGKLVIGICNGFQILVKAGILPGTLNDQASKKEMMAQTSTLTNNDSGKFEDRWIHLKVTGKSVWTKGVKEIIYLPVAHAEGKFIPQDEETLRTLKQNGQVAFQYVNRDGQNPKYPENPNGSVDDIAGITDKTGRVLGLMPHPERHFLLTQHPMWTRLAKKEKFGDGAKIFENGVHYVKKNLL